MLVIVDFRLFDRLVFVIKAEKRGNAKAQEHTQQEKDHDRSDAGYEPVGNDSNALNLYFSPDRVDKTPLSKSKRLAEASLSSWNW